jgi:hypothetical protein
LRTRLANNQKRAGKTIRPKERPKGENVVDPMEALRRSVGREVAPAKAAKARQEAAEGGGGPEGDADADRRKEARKGSAGEEVVCQVAAEVGRGG